MLLSTMILLLAAIKTASASFDLEQVGDDPSNDLIVAVTDPFDSIPDCIVQKIKLKLDLDSFLQFHLTSRRFRDLSVSIAPNFFRCITVPDLISVYDRLIHKIA